MIGIKENKLENNIKEVTLDTILYQNKDIDVSDIDGEKVMMDLEKGKYYVMNDVASDIWNIIEKPMEVRDIINSLLKEYEVENDICMEAVLNFLNEMREKEVIVVR